MGAELQRAGVGKRYFNYKSICTVLFLNYVLFSIKVLTFT